MGELKQKHLLARNLRLVPGFCAAHRTQIRRLLAVSSWPRIESAKPAMRSLRQLRWRAVKAHVPPWRKTPSRLEEDAFQTHFAVSQAAAELLRLTHLPDDAPAHPALSLPSETLLVSLRVCKESLRQPHRQRQLALGRGCASGTGRVRGCAAAEDGRGGQLGAPARPPNLTRAPLHAPLRRQAAEHDLASLADRGPAGRNGRLSLPL